MQEFFHVASGFLIYNVAPFILVLSTLVFVHELGHYLVARYNNVRVEVFSIGFGPEITGWTDRSGTRWKFSLVPLGGYVKMFSDLNPASQPDSEAVSRMTDAEKEVSLFHKTVRQRMAVSAAGPFANYLFAILILSCLYAAVGQRTPSDAPRVGRIVENSAAHLAGLKTDDLVLTVNGNAVKLFTEFQKIIRDNPEKEMTLQILRDNQEIMLKVTPHKLGNRGILGISQGVEKNIIPLYKAPFAAISDVMRISWSTLSSFGQILTGKQSAESLSGPLGIASITGQAARENPLELVWLAAFLSISLGLINLLPIPVLDGGHLLFYFIEAIRGKPVGEKAQELGYKIGFGIVMCLIVVSTWNDLSGFRFFEMIARIFN